MSSQRGDDNRLGIRPHDRPTGRERVGGRSGRSGQDHAVGAVGRHFLPVDNESEVNGMRDVGVHHDSFIKRPVIGLGPVGALHRDIKRHATLHGEVAFPDRTGKVASTSVAELRQETHMTGVNAEQRNAKRTGTRCGHEECSVAADRQHHVNIATRRVVDDVNPLLLKRLCEAHRARNRVGTMAMTNHQNTSHWAPPAGPASTARRM